MPNEPLAGPTQDAPARMPTNWNADVPAFDSIYTQAMQMVHALTDGIIKQYPDKV